MAARQSISNQEIANGTVTTTSRGNPRNPMNPKLSKAEAARLNGQKGGRPRKQRGPTPQDSAEHLGKGATGHGRKSEAVREQAILALLSEKTLAKAAERCGVNERTLRVWLADDTEFKAKYDQARSLAYQTGLARIQGLFSKAVETLDELLEAKKFPAVRLGAA